MALVTKSFSDIITFTRASTGTFFNSAGVLTSAAIDTPRFDYNPSTLAAQGLLIEEQRTNLITSSAVLPTPGVNVAITSDAFAAPDGTTTGDQILDNAVLSEHYTDSSFTPTAATNYTFSAFIRAIGATSSPFACLRMAGDFAAFVFVNLSTFAITTGGANFVDASIQPINNGWYRVSVTGLSVGTAASVARIQVTNATSLNAYSGTGQGFAVWGRQLEAGAFPTSYIPTSGTTLTRELDQPFVNTVTPWYNATASSLVADYQLLAGSATATSTSRFAADITSGASTNRLAIQAIINALLADRILIRSNGGTQLSFSSNGSTVGTTPRVVAAAYADNDFAASATGATTIATSTGSAMPISISSMRLGGNVGNGNNGQLNGWLRRVTYYPRRLSNAELLALTA